MTTLDDLDEKRKKRRRRKMEEFEIHEVSSVDKPAQEHALARITKNSDADHPQEDEMSEYSKTAQDFFEKVDAIQMRDRCSRTVAMSKARQTYGGAYARYQAAARSHGEHRAFAKAKLAQKQRDGEVNMAIDALREQSPKLTRTAALRRLRRERPTLFEAS